MSLSSDHLIQCLPKYSPRIAPLLGCQHHLQQFDKNKLVQLNNEAGDKKDPKGVRTYIESFTKPDLYF